MSVRTNFSFIRMEDGVLAISMTPPQPVGGWNLRFERRKYPESSGGIVTKVCASGFGGTNVSGIIITNSGNGTIQVVINSADNSGDPFPYHHRLERLDSGYRSVLLEGFYTLR